MTRKRRRALRAPWARHRRARDGKDEELGTPWTSSFETSTRVAGAPRNGRRGTADRDAEIVNALGRVADTFARIADGLDADRRERRSQFEADHYDRRRQLDAVEFLLREMAIGIEGATAATSFVVGGSIEPDSGDDNASCDPAIDLTDTTDLSLPRGPLSDG